MVPSQLNGLEHPGVLDALAHDTRADKVVLAIYAMRPWTGEDFQLFQLQEKLNAYVSFVLDGELQENFPDLSAKSVEIQLRTLHDPDAKALAFIEHVREQLALQQITFEIVHLHQAEGDCGLTGCDCH
jgi:Family of unknown function (DUF6572)